MKLWIQPVTSTITYTVHSISIHVLSLTLFEGATIRILYFLENGELCPYSNLPSEVALTSEEYRAWGENDQYLIAQILNKVGLTSVPPPNVDLPMEPGEPEPIQE